MTHRRSYIHQNVAVTVDHVPRSGERSYEALECEALIFHLKETGMILTAEDGCRNKLSRKSRAKAIARGQGKKKKWKQRKQKPQPASNKSQEPEEAPKMAFVSWLCLCPELRLTGR